MYKEYNISILYESKCLGYVEGVQYQYTVRESKCLGYVQGIC